ncbi:hypothetical protein MPLB_20053 [Mesorhizobium sp. ORS 3324]|nr:hypothetical protein MPLB_20053 [Mesorhizobium sp. ORS 3324]
MRDVEAGDALVGVDRLPDGRGDVRQREIRIHDGLVDRVGILDVELGQAGDLVHQVGHLQRRQRVELAEAEGLAGIVGLEEGGAETVVGEACPVDRLAAERMVPDLLAAFPQVVAVVHAGAFLEFRPLHEIADVLAFIGEGELARQIGDRLDVIGLQPVVGVDIVGVLADDGADDMHRIDAVGGGRLPDLGAKLGVVLQQSIDLAIFGLEGGVGSLGAPAGGAGDIRLHAVAVPRRHHGRGIGACHRRRQCQAEEKEYTFLHAPPLWSGSAIDETANPLQPFVYAIPDGKPLGTFPGAALEIGGKLGKAAGRVETGQACAGTKGGQMVPSGHTSPGLAVRE